MHVGVGGLADGFRASTGATNTADKPTSPATSLDCHAASSRQPQRESSSISQPLPTPQGAPATQATTQQT